MIHSSSKELQPSIQGEVTILEDFMDLVYQEMMKIH